MEYACRLGAVWLGTGNNNGYDAVDANEIANGFFICGKMT